MYRGYKYDNVTMSETQISILYTLKTMIMEGEMKRVEEQNGDTLYDLSG